MPEITNETEMKDFTLNIIEVLHNEKKKRGKFPDNPTRSEVVDFIKNKVDRAVRTLEKEGILKTGEMWDYDNRYYELQK